MPAPGTCGLALRLRRRPRAGQNQGLRQPHSRGEGSIEGTPGHVPYPGLAPRFNGHVQISFLRPAPAGVLAARIQVQFRGAASASSVLATAEIDMHAIIICRHSSMKAVAGRAAALACTSAAGLLLLAGCATGPEVDPIFKVVPPARQQSYCRPGTPNCRAQRPQRRPAAQRQPPTGY